MWYLFCDIILHYAICNRFWLFILIFELLSLLYMIYLQKCIGMNSYSKSDVDHSASFTNAACGKQDNSWHWRLYQCMGKRRPISNSWRKRFRSNRPLNIQISLNFMRVLRRITISSSYQNLPRQICTKFAKFHHFPSIKYSKLHSK